MSENDNTVYYIPKNIENTTFYSAKSHINHIDTSIKKEPKTLNFKGFEKILNKRNTNDKLVDGYSSTPSNKSSSSNYISSEESLSSENKYYKKDFSKMKDLMKIQDYNKINEIRSFIISKEIDMRRKASLTKWDKLEELEAKLIKIKYNENNKEDINYNDLVLANINPDEGYLIINKDKLSNIVHKDTFCGFDYYTMKK